MWAFVREIAAIAAPSDFMFLIDHVFGLPKVGWAPGAYGQTPRLSPPECEVATLRNEVDKHNLSIIVATRSTGDI